MNTYSPITSKPKHITDAEFRRDAHALMAEIGMLSLFDRTDESAKTERLERGRTDPFYFYRTYLPHYFGDDPAEWHGEFVQDLQRTDIPVAITAQRGGAKSTLIFAEIIRWVCYRMHHLIVYRLDTLEKAEFYTQRVLIELQHNQRLRSDFGALVSSDAARGDFSCSDEETKRTFCRVVAFGTNMSLRGFINENNRPDVIISEDLQDRSSAESEKRTEKELRRLVRDARPALVPKGWKFLVVGNIICHGSMMDRLLSDDEFTKIVKRRYPAEYVDSNGVRRSSWPSRFPIELLDSTREQIGDDGYDAEYLCKAVEVGTVFQLKRDIHHYQMLPEELDYTSVVIQIDPAISGTNDFTAMAAVVSYTHDTNRPDFGRWCDSNGVAFGEGIYLIVLDLFIRQVGIDEMLGAVHEFDERWRPYQIRCDGSVDKETVFERFFSEYEARMGISFPLHFDRFDISKDSRIRSLQPYMARKRILLPGAGSEDTKTLVRQLIRYGKSDEHDDGPDMLAAAMENVDPSRQSYVNVYVL
ncbi:MAG: hypothetical protein JSS75_01905 [Bacteroidetes bacterium]|nr:hypothetical protein [Bacteroidota bacterium]